VTSYPPHRLLTAADEARLSRRIQRGDREARNEMIESNLRLVHSIARGYAGSGVPYEDLVQEGTIGLVRAVEKFDHRRGLKFSTYAVWWIRRAVVNAVGDQPTIRVPAGAGRGLAAVRRAETELRSRTTETVAARTGLTPARVSTLQGAARVTASLDEQIGEDGAALGELVADPDPVDPWREVDRDETRRQVSWMMKLLPERHREVVMRRYGLNGEEAQTHAQIGAWLGVGEERSRQLEREALHRLRELGGGSLQAAA
jgi:RNA polymerase primary sigma factor